MGRAFHVHAVIEEDNAQAVMKIMWRDVDGQPYVPTAEERDEAVKIISEETGASYKGSLNIGGEIMGPGEEADALIQSFFKGKRVVN